MTCKHVSSEKMGVKKVPLHKEDGDDTQRDGRLHSQSSAQLVNISKLQSKE